jgi:nitric oxide reductase NorD protein
MALHPMDLMEPEETSATSGTGSPSVWPRWRALPPRRRIGSVRPGLTLLFRALGGKPGVEIAASPATASRHRRGLGAGLADSG